MTGSLETKVWPAIGVVLASFAGFFLFQDARRASRTVLMVLSPEEAQQTAERSGFPIDDFWERAKTIGVSGMALRGESLSVLLDRGDAVRISRGDAEKWRMAGLISPNAPIKADSLWFRDSSAVTRVAEAMRQQRIAASTQAFQSVWTLSYPESFDPSGFSVGFDPGSARFAHRSGLTPVFLARGPQDLSALDAFVSHEKDEGKPGVCLLLGDASGASAARFSGGAPAIRFFARPGAWGAWSSGSAGLWPVAALVPSQRALLAGEIFPGASMAAVWREVQGRGARLLAFHLSPALGVEGNLDVLRATAGRLRSAGFPPGTPEEPAGAQPTPAALRMLRLVLALVLAALAPLSAVRQGLFVLRRLRHPKRWPQASPVLELGAGFAAIVGGAAALGLAAYALMAFPEWRVGQFFFPWRAWASAVPLAMSVLALYVLDFRDWRKRLENPITYLGLLKVLAVAGLVALLLFPRRVTGGHTAAIIMPWPDLWWLGLRWREVFIGDPCLLIGLWKYLRHLKHLEQSHDGKTDVDPRPWLVAGLLGPIGILQVFGAARSPIEFLLAQTAEGALIGAALGVIGLLWLSLRRFPAYPSAQSGHSSVPHREKS